MIPSWASPDTLNAWAMCALLAAGVTGAVFAAVLHRADRKAREARERAREEYLADQEKTYLPWLEGQFAARKGRSLCRG